MFVQQQKAKKKPPPRPPPPNFIKYKSQSSFNLNQGVPSLIEWSPPSSPKQEKSVPFGGSISSSYSSSTSSLTSSKRSFESEPSPSLLNLNFVAPVTNWDQKEKSSNGGGGVKPRIIRPAPKNNSYSPPMPKLPPPSPPKDLQNVVTPYGVAIHEFPATQPGDLPLQVDDVVVLIRRVSDEWLYGQVCNKEGIFPANFIHVEVPLPGESKLVTALYEFSPQMPGDLELKPGQTVKVIRTVSDDWLYGECNGRIGQFPRNYVS